MFNVHPFWTYSQDSITSCCSRCSVLLLQYKDTWGCHLYQCAEHNPISALCQDHLCCMPAKHRYCKISAMITYYLHRRSRNLSTLSSLPTQGLDHSGNAIFDLSVLLAPLCYKSSFWKAGLDTYTHLSPNIMDSCRHCVHASWNHCSQRKHCNIFRYHLRGDGRKR